MNGAGREVVLGDVLTFSNGSSSPKRSDDMPYPVYGSNGIIGFSGETNTSPKAIVIGRVGSYCGSLHFSDKHCWVTDNAIRANSLDGNCAQFLFYLLHTLHLNEWRTGSGQPLLNQTILSNIPTTVPSLPEQRAIAHILGALDDKIELNRRMKPDSGGDGPRHLPGLVRRTSARFAPSWRAATPTYRRTSGPSSPTASSSRSWARYRKGGR